MRLKQMLIYPNYQHITLCVNFSVVTVRKIIFNSEGEKNLSTGSRLFYHIAKDVIVLPSFAALTVVTEAKFNANERKCWSHVTGFEAIGKTLMLEDD